MDVIGKTCFYRPLFCLESKKAKVVKVEKVKSFYGKEASLITLDDGAVVNGDGCYFSLSEMA